MAGFLTPLKLEFLDGKKWRILVPFEYRIGRPEGPLYVTIPEGYLTDFASVPRGLWNLFPPTGPYGKAAVVHDFLYQRGRAYADIGPYMSHVTITRKHADQIFLEAMNVLGVRWWPRIPVYLGVRVGGWMAWNKYREDEHATELER